MEEKGTLSTRLKGNNVFWRDLVRNDGSAGVILEARREITDLFGDLEGSVGNEMSCYVHLFVSITLFI